MSYRHHSLNASATCGNTAADPMSACADCESYDHAAGAAAPPACSSCRGGIIVHILLLVSLTMGISSAAIAVIVTREVAELKEIQRTLQLQTSSFSDFYNEPLGYHEVNAEKHVGDSKTGNVPLVGPPSFRSMELCVPCEDLAWDPDGLDLITSHFEISSDGNSVNRVCCVNKYNATQLGALMKSFFTQSIAQELYPDDPGIEESSDGRMNLSQQASALKNLYKEHASAHLLGAPQTHDVHEGVVGLSGAHRITSWISDGDVAHRRHVNYKEGRLIIPRDGLYYVYTQVHFVEYRFGGGRSHNGESQRVSHFLFRFNNFYPSVGEERLLQSSESKSWAADVFEHTSYLGATFRLRAGDEMYVAVSDPKLIHGDFKSSYFGVVQIS